MNKIDFFGGTHGNFLELMINLFVYQIDFDQTQPFFNQNGACHLKNINPCYHPVIKQNHYSWYKIPFDSADTVIEIHCEQKNMLIALTNSFLRAGNQTFDLDNLHQGTIKKLLAMPKAKGFLDTLVIEHGEHENYPRSVIRNYFYSKFNRPEFGLGQVNTFLHQGKKHVFPFSAFFNLEEFFLNLNRCAFFLEQNFYPNDNCVRIWNEFMSQNQGYQSQVKCQNILRAILTKSDMKIDTLNLLEEAWIQYMIEEIFRCYNHDMFYAERWPSNTLDLANQVYGWKSNDYPNA